MESLLAGVLSKKMIAAQFDSKFVALPIQFDLTFLLIDEYFTVRGKNLVTQTSRVP